MYNPGKSLKKSAFPVVMSIINSKMFSIPQKDNQIHDLKKRKNNALLNKYLLKNHFQSIQMQIVNNYTYK